ncbi:MAG: hypothetical protein JRD00_05860 [Deltaproteobacteria bacterium]|nr:hypothetical protein [Deltaproteobacteria bacterium]
MLDKSASTTTWHIESSLFLPYAACPACPGHSAGELACPEFIEGVEGCPLILFVSLDLSVSLP